MPVHRLEHAANRKRRLFAGPLNVAHNREVRLMRLAEGHVPRKRRLFAGPLNAAYHRELRVREGEALGTRRLFAHHLKGEFGGFVRDPYVRKSRAKAQQAPIYTARQERFFHSL